ncbi:hypothetical protein ruthe_02615 [Rubellimicrobium thermophilum DSM 16684]|uniref:Phosphatase n=1 Tax=Rubellimicrobium thermophilum DSM 16684 TaxID=1123069 RepID=S9QW50_9RHOB|nr:hypothetical protein ruthe_02615 [Rubellimicrobium thermophilum DSM 16684]
MPRIAGVIFDKDGTLFDFQSTWGLWSRRLIEVESRGDPALAAQLAEVLGYDLATGRFRPDSLAIAHTTETVAAAMLPLLPWTDGESLRARMDALAAQVPQVEAAPLREVLGRLKAMGLTLGLATNDSEGPARVHLAGAGWTICSALSPAMTAAGAASPGRVSSSPLPNPRASIRRTAPWSVTACMIWLPPGRPGCGGSAS